MTQRISDEYGRSFKTLRVSLLNNCNFGCTYCVQNEEEVNGRHQTGTKHLPAATFILLIQQLHQTLNLEVIRLTGGEPLLYPHLADVIKGAKDAGIPKIKLTTNAFLLERQVTKLKDAGLQSINISLDAVDEDAFFLMSRRSNVQRVLNGIEAAISAGLQVKLNAVLMKGINDQQIIPLLQYAFKHKITIRFLEVMSMGHLYNTGNKYLVSKDDILHTIANHFDFVPMVRQHASTANYWKTADGNVFGIIANESAPFCHDCNRLRLDSEGNIYGCLSSNDPIGIQNLNGEELEEKLIEALHQKQTLRFKGSELSMLNIGG